GKQMMESIILHLKIDKKEAKSKCIELLQQVGITRAESIFKSYPHHLSGGMRQRVLIAIAISCDPKLLIADEQTTALDVTIQAQILQLMEKLTNDIGMSVLIITHDLGVVAELADRVAIMYAGKIVEQTDVFTLFKDPRHPYTKGLIQ